MNKATPEMIAEYKAGKSIKQVADTFKVSAGKMYYLLLGAGCTFRKRGHPEGFEMSEQVREKIAQKHKGKPRSRETRSKLSESKKCHFNGLNGYGHTKEHCRGYVLAYAPEHPKAHADGYVMLHTVIVERAIGRYLNMNEVVHHIDRNRSNNDISNLLLMDKKEHMSKHMKERHSKGGMTYQ